MRRAGARGVDDVEFVDLDLDLDADTEHRTSDAGPEAAPRTASSGGRQRRRVWPLLAVIATVAAIALVSENDGRAPTAAAPTTTATRPGTTAPLNGLVTSVPRSEPASAPTPRPPTTISDRYAPVAVANVNGTALLFMASDAIGAIYLLDANDPAVEVVADDQVVVVRLASGRVRAYSPSYSWDSIELGHADRLVPAIGGDSVWLDSDGTLSRVAWDESGLTDASDALAVPEDLVVVSETPSGFGVLRDPDGDGRGALEVLDRTLASTPTVMTDVIVLAAGPTLAVVVSPDCTLCPLYVVDLASLAVGQVPIDLTGRMGPGILSPGERYLAVPVLLDRVDREDLFSVVVIDVFTGDSRSRDPLASFTPLRFAWNGAAASQLVIVDGDGAMKRFDPLTATIGRFMSIPSFSDLTA